MTTTVTHPDHPTVDPHPGAKSSEHYRSRWGQISRAHPTGTSTAQSGGPPITTSATYNPANPICGGKPGEQCTVKDGDGNITTYAYDPSGNLTTSTPPAGGALKASSYTTNGSGQTATVLDGKGQTTTTIYDAFGRTAKVTVGASTVAFGYDQNGRTLTRTDPAGITSHLYDHLGRQTSETLPNETTPLGATYDPDGNTLTYSDATGTVTYGYNADNQVASVADPGGSCTTNPATLCTTFGYNNNGTRTTTTYPNGVTMTVNPDNSGRTAEISATSGSTKLYDYAYSYTKTYTDQSLIQTRIDLNAPSPNPVTNYGYDVLNRLTSATVNSGAMSPTTASWLYCYDPAGNRTTDSTNIGATCSAPGAGANHYTYDPTDALATQNGSAAGISYDNNGNQTAGPGVQPLSAETYGGFNQLSQISANGNLMSATYAGATNAERTTTTTGSATTNYGNGFFGLVNEVAGSSTTGYTRDPSGALIDERIGSGTYYYLYDASGSVIGLTNSSGAEVNSYQYDPYGNTISQTGIAQNHFGYEGGFQDNTGLIKFGERYYNPKSGQWTQLDPSGKTPGYAYAADDPISMADVSGTFPQSVSFAAGSMETLNASIDNSVMISITNDGPAGEFSITDNNGNSLNVLIASGETASFSLPDAFGQVDSSVTVTANSVNAFGEGPTLFVATLSGDCGYNCSFYFENVIGTPVPGPSVTNND